MRRHLSLVIAVAAAAVLLGPPAAVAAPGGVFITGHDPDFHSIAGNTTGARNTIRRAVEFVTSTAPADLQPSMLVVSSRISPPPGHLDSVVGLQLAGYTFDTAAAPGQGVLDLTSVDFAPYDVIVVASDFGGILRQAELDILNARTQDLIDFVNGGGGLVALAEGNSGSHLTPGGGHFDFLPFVASEVPLDQTEDGNTVTAFGASLGLTNADVNGNFSHTVFSEAGGFEVVDIDDSVPARALSLAVRGKKICPEGVPEADVVDDPSHHEGDAGDVTPFAFRVRLSLAPCDGPAQVSYATADGSADSGDYTDQAGTLTFQEGETEKTVEIAGLGDDIFEPDETFLFDLVGSSGAAIADSQGIGTILNDDPQNQDPSCDDVAAGPGTLWPPNHKLQTITLTGGTDPDGDTVTITIIAVTQDEPVDGLGDGDTAPDAAAGSSPNSVRVRAERSGQRDGRVYRIAFSGTDSNGGACTGATTVGVPHDRGSGSTAVDSGDSYDSLGS